MRTAFFLCVVGLSLLNCAETVDNRRRVLFAEQIGKTRRLFQTTDEEDGEDGAEVVSTISDETIESDEEDSNNGDSSFGAQDAGFEDAGGQDAGFEDPGGQDAGFEDAGSQDAGFDDPGAQDAGFEDTGDGGEDEDTSSFDSEGRGDNEPERTTEQFQTQDQDADLSEETEAEELNNDELLSDSDEEDEEQDEEDDPQHDEDLAEGEGPFCYECPQDDDDDGGGDCEVCHCPTGVCVGPRANFPDIRPAENCPEETCGRLEGCVGVVWWCEADPEPEDTVVADVGQRRDGGGSNSGAGPTLGIFRGTDTQPDQGASGRQQIFATETPPNQGRPRRQEASAIPGQTIAQQSEQPGFGEVRDAGTVAFVGGIDESDEAEQFLPAPEEEEDPSESQGASTGVEEEAGFTVVTGV